MNSQEILALLNTSLQQHDLQTAIRDMFKDKVWASVISPSTVMGLPKNKD